MSVTALTIDPEFKQQGSSKKAWVDFIRQDIKLGDKEPCFVCGKHEHITHGHHLVPAFHMAEMLEATNKSKLDIDVLRIISVRYVWLCPNHHAYWHHIDSGNGQSAYESLSDDERERFNLLSELTQKAFSEFRGWLFDA